MRLWIQKSWNLLWTKRYSIATVENACLRRAVNLEESAWRLGSRKSRERIGALGHSQDRSLRILEEAWVLCRHLHLL